MKKSAPSQVRKTRSPPSNKWKYIKRYKQCRFNGIVAMGITKIIEQRLFPYSEGWRLAFQRGTCAGGSDLGRRVDAELGKWTCAYNKLTKPSSTRKRAYSPARFLKMIARFHLCTRAIITHLTGLGLVPDESQLVVGSCRARVATPIDLRLRHKETGEYFLIEVKTGYLGTFVDGRQPSDGTRRLSWRMKPPFDQEPSSPLTFARIQLVWGWLMHAGVFPHLQVPASNLIVVNATSEGAVNHYPVSASFATVANHAILSLLVQIANRRRRRDW